jgi:hypothetical protein
VSEVDPVEGGHLPVRDGDARNPGRTESTHIDN